MPIEILTAASDDGAVLADVFFAAFNTDFDRRILPPTPDVRDWLAAKFNRVSNGQYVNPTGSVLIKAVDTATGDVVGFAQWKLPSPELPSPGENTEKEKKVLWPKSGDTALCKKHFNAMHEKEEELMGSTPHLCMYLYPKVSLVDILSINGNSTGYARDSPKLWWSGHRQSTSGLGAGGG